MEGVLVTGTAQPRSRASARGAWGRSTTRSRSSSRSCSSTTTATTDPDEDDEVSTLQDDLLDLEPLLRDAVVLALPFQPLCEDDCPGLCVECGARLADDPDHAHEAADRPAVGRTAGLPSSRRDQKQTDLSRTTLTGPDP